MFDEGWGLCTAHAATHIGWEHKQVKTPTALPQQKREVLHPSVSVMDKLDLTSRAATQGAW